MPAATIPPSQAAASGTALAADAAGPSEDSLEEVSSGSAKPTGSGGVDDVGGCERKWKGIRCRGSAGLSSASAATRDAKAKSKGKGYCRLEHGNVNVTIERQSRG